MVLAPWRDPIPFTRSWCLWEVLCTLQTGAVFSVQLSKAEAGRFVHELAEDWQVWQAALSQIDIRRAGAFDQLRISDGALGL
jgi:hypothetical protein